MPFVYKNRSTGQEVARDTRSARFDSLPANWELIQADDSPEPEERPAELDPVSPAGPAGDPGPDAPVDPEPPLKNASKETWAEYAIAIGGDPAYVNTLKRDELINEFGPR